MKATNLPATPSDRRPHICDCQPNEKRRCDRNLDHAETVLAAIDYLHRNPVRRGLVERAVDWQWSSARWYEALPYEPNIELPNLETMPAEFLVQTAR